MLRIIAVLVLLLWILGLFTGHTMGGFIHTLLVLAIVLGLIGFGSRQKSVEVDFRAAAPQFWLLMLFVTRLPAHPAKTISRTIKMPIM